MLVSRVTIGVISGLPQHPQETLKNAAIVLTGELDWEREETWTVAIDRSLSRIGMSAKMATLYAKGKLALNEDFHHEGILGTIFKG